MSNKYDTILKEKKTYEEPKKTHKHKYFKLTFFLAIIISILIIAISYIAYYNTILDNESIFLNNITNFKKTYYSLYKDIKFDYDLKNNYLIEGSIDVGNENYNYSFTKYSNILKREIFKENQKITYYYDGKDSYIKMSNLGDFYIKESFKPNDLKYYKENLNSIKEDFNSYLYSSIIEQNSYDIFNKLYNLDNTSNNIIPSIKDNYKKYITSDKYVRKFYLDNKEPTIEVNLILDKKDLNNILGENNSLQIKDDYQLNITMKNNAIFNNTKETKIIINNKTTKKRSVIEIKPKAINYTNNKNEKYNIKYNVNKNDIKIKKNGILYSVIQLSAKNKTNIYNYKVIDKIYTISLLVEKVKNNFEYSIETNIENEAKAVVIKGEYKKPTPLNENINNSINIDSLSIEQQKAYHKTIEELFK